MVCFCICLSFKVWLCPSTFLFYQRVNKKGNNTTVIGSDSNHLATFPKFSKMFTRERIDGVDTIWVKTLKYSGTGGIKRILSWIDLN